MKVKLFFVIVFLSFFFLTTSSNAQWTVSNGLEGASVSDIVVLDSTVFFCGVNGVYQKSIYGGEWTNNIKNRRFHIIEKTDSVLFALGHYAFYRSLDYGDHWEEIDWSIGAVGLKTMDNKVIISDYYNLLVSYDFCDTWDTIPMNFPNSGVDEFFVSDTTLIVKYYSDQEHHLCYSNNLGEQWSLLTYDGLPYHQFDISFYHDSIFAATNNGMYVYNGFLFGWEPINDGLGDYKIRELEIVNDTLYCVGDKGVLFFENNAWVAENDGLETTELNCLSHFDNQKVCGGNWGPFKKEGSGNWEVFYQGLKHLNVNEVIAHNGNVWAITNKGLFKSENLGIDFELVEFEEFSVCREIVCTDSLYYLSTNSGLLISDDFGSSWINISDSSVGYGKIAIGSDYIFYSTHDLFYRITHSNYYWDYLPSWIAQENIRHLTALDSGLVVSITGEEKGMYISFNNGSLFTRIFPGYANELIADNDSYYAVYPYHTFNKSNDGLNWIEFPFPNIEWYGDNLAANQEAIVVGGSLLGITLYHIMVGISYNGGRDWEEISFGLPIPNWPTINDVELYDNRVFATPNNNSLWYRDDLLVGTVNNHPQKETDNILLYPNPAISLLTVKITETGNVDGDIFIRDMHGKMLLQTNIKSAQTQLNIESLSSGIYILQFISQDKNLTKKFLKQ